MFARMREVTAPRMIAGILLAAGMVYRCHGEGPKFSFENVREMARALAGREFEPEKNSDLPEAFRKLTFDEYNRIRFRPEHNLWKNDRVRFMVQFFQRGYLYQDSVQIHTIDAGRVSDVLYSPEMFDFDTDRVPTNLPATTGFAGFRLLYPLNME
ncbi:MAG TPA: glucan biosynthesis protein, partial [Verrucomicrobiae bacterium]|nr:glucan biosynthesis protein [Verrucomicrobiae bacterium]